ncbi:MULTISPECIES: hypothetical protein [Salinibaculum]|uniref:hypothetical protein n=1 Tax=Salinibaculum TaxID=2732368 RepID=UPI0030CBF28C
MSEHSRGGIDESGERLQTATEALDGPIADLSEQVDELADRMGEFADGMKAFEETRERLAQVHEDDPTGRRGPRPASD